MKNRNSNVRPPGSARDPQVAASPCAESAPARPAASTPASVPSRDRKAVVIPAVLLLPALLLLADCTKTPPSATQAASEPKADRPSNTVTLSAQTQKDAGVAVEEVALRSMPQVLRATARVTNDESRTWRVGAITEGRIVSVLANPGDIVQPSQVLARMHSHDIHEARADYRKSVAELSRLKAVQAYALRARDRARRLYELKAGSLEQLEHAETELHNAETAVRNGEVEMARTEQHLTEFLGIRADAPEHQPGEQHDDTELIPVKAPAGGIVLARNVTPGTVVTPSMDLFVLSDLRSLWAMAEVNEEHLPKIRAGMPVKLFVQAYGDKAFNGRIGKIGEILDPATHTVKVRVDLPNPAGALKPEMYATAEIELGGSEPAIFVPSEALQEVRGGNVVFVQTAGDRFEIRPVQTGRALAGAIEIVGGLKPRDRVSVRGAFVLKSEFLKSSLAEE